MDTTTITRIKVVAAFYLLKVSSLLQGRISSTYDLQCKSRPRQDQAHATGVEDILVRLTSLWSLYWEEP